MPEDLTGWEKPSKRLLHASSPGDRVSSGRPGCELLLPLRLNDCGALREHRICVRAQLSVGAQHVAASPEESRVLRGPKDSLQAELCSILQMDFGECTFHALG